MTPVLPRLATAAVLALAYLPSAAANKGCLEFDTLSGILKQAEETDVLVKIDKQYAYGDDEDQYKNLCQLYEDTSDKKKSAVVIGKVKGDVEKELAKDLGAEDEDSWATFVLIKKGTKKSKLSQEMMKYDGEKTSEAVVEYLHKETGATIGSFVYSLGLMDAMAARFVDIEKDAKFADLRKKAIAYTSKALSLIIKIRADEEIKTVANMYVKAFFKSIEDGDYAKVQTERIKKLTDKDNKMSSAKREQMSQKLHILSKFTDPVELTPEQQRQFYISVAMNASMLVVFFIMLVQMIFFGDGGAKKEDVSEDKGQPEPAEEDNGKKTD